MNTNNYKQLTTEENIWFRSKIAMVNSLFILLHQIHIRTSKRFVKTLNASYLIFSINKVKLQSYLSRNLCLKK